MLLCAHLDTVPLDGPVEVEREDGVLSNRHEAILGGDNKAAVATILGAVRRLVEPAAPRGLELLFTTCEERALRGAKAFDRGRAAAEFGFVFDHASPMGEIVGPRRPTTVSRPASAAGRPTPASARRPAATRSRRQRARWPRCGSAGSTTRPPPTSGRIQGGTSANVVAERCMVELEARSLDDARAGEVVSEMVDALHGGGERRGLRRGDLRRAALPGLPAAAHRAAVETAAAALESLRDRARVHRHRRRQRRQRMHRSRAPGA